MAPDALGGHLLVPNRGDNDLFRKRSIILVCTYGVLLVIPC
jgi:hypothetical protein